MTRSLKNLYPEKYEDWKQSEKYKLINKLQTEATKAKDICKQEANYICAICGAEALDAHHIVPLDESESNDQSNLVCLCRKCHQQVHKGVYIIDPITKEIKVGKVDNIDPDKKPEYVKEFERKLNITIYKNTGKYYAFIDGVKTQFTAAEMKETVGYVPITTKKKLKANIKKQNVKDRKLLEQYKQMFKEAGNTAMWHQLCKVINAWDDLDDLQKNHVFEVLHRFFSK